MIDFDTLVTGPCMAVFGEPIRYRTAGTPAFACLVTGVFDEANVDQFPIAGLEPGVVVNTHPILGVQLSQFAAAGILPAQDDLLTVVRTGRTYQVAKVRVDGHGGARLDLNTADGLAYPP